MTITLQQKEAEIELEIQRELEQEQDDQSLYTQIQQDNEEPIETIDDESIEDLVRTIKQMLGHVVKEVENTDTGRATHDLS